MEGTSMNSPISLSWKGYPLVEVSKASTYLVLLPAASECCFFVSRTYNPRILMCTRNLILKQMSQKSMDPDLLSSQSILEWRTYQNTCDVLKIFPTAPANPTNKTFIKQSAVSVARKRESFGLHRWSLKRQMLIFSYKTSYLPVCIKIPRLRC